MNNAEIYKKALELLADPEMDKRVVWLHDFDAEVYRSKEGYTHNGVHWGYASALVNSLMHSLKLDMLEGDTSMTYAFFEGDGIENHKPTDYITCNSRYSKHTFGEVRGPVMKNIGEKLKQAEQQAKENDNALAQWDEVVRKDFAPYADRVMRLETKDGNLVVISIKPKRYVRRGMGNFFENIQRGEISCSKDALNWLKGGQERRGLMGLEVFAHPIIAGFMSLADAFESKDVSVQKGAVEKLEPLLTIEG